MRAREASSDNNVDTHRDGKNGDAALFLDQQHLAMDSYALRTTLADRIDAFVKNAPFLAAGQVVLAAQRNNASTITSDALSGSGLLYDDLAEDRSVLFPADVPVRPFDHTAPTITLGFASPNEQAKNGDSLTGTVAITGTASDTSGVASFDVVTPGVPDLFSSVEDLRVEIDGSVAPNRADVNTECGIDITAPPMSLADPDRQVCVCAEAADTVANSVDAALCFTRPRPVVTSGVSPFVGASTTSISAQAQGSFDLLGCEATLSEGGRPIASSTGAASGSQCSVAVPTTGMASGAAVLGVDVTEIGGAVTSQAFPFTVDLVAPTGTITAPAAGAFLAAAPAVTASVHDDNLASVTLDVLTNGAPAATGLVGTISSSGAVTFPAFTDSLPDGLRTIHVTATDAAGNSTTATRSYSKDTTAPALVALAAADGNPLAFFQLTATTAFAASSQCSQFPFNGCVFNIAPSTTTQSVPLRTTAASADTYHRWQHLAGTATNPSTTANPAAENRAPTLRLKTDPGTTVEARVDSSCPSDASFASRTRATFTANNLGLVDIPIIDAQNLTDPSAMLLRNQLGASALCMSMRPRDQAGNVGAVVHHFFKYEATPAPLFMVYNAGPYDPASFVDDVKSLDNGHDDKALSGSGQGTAGRVFAHAYLVSPSTTTSYSYHYALNTGDAPKIVVNHHETAQISKVRAFNWCFTTENGVIGIDHDDNLVNPDFMGPDEVGSPPDEPFWYGSSFLGQQKFGPSWALYVPTGSNLLGANATIEHNPHPSSEPDSTFSFSPAFSYPTSSDTTEEGQTTSFNVALPTVSLDAWSFNTVTGQPDNLLASGSSVSFTAGGSSNSARNVLLLFRAPVPTNALTLKTASVLTGQTGTLGFNSSCDARKTATSAIIGQATTLKDNHWVVVDAAIPNFNVEPAPAKPFLWVISGQFPYCDGTAAHDCRYGRYFDDYDSATWSWPAGRALTPSAKIGAVTGAPNNTQTAQPIPATSTRALSQEP